MKAHASLQFRRSMMDMLRRLFVGLMLVSLLVSMAFFIKQNTSYSNNSLAQRSLNVPFKPIAIMSCEEFLVELDMPVPSVLMDSQMLRDMENGNCTMSENNRITIGVEATYFSHNALRNPQLDVLFFTNNTKTNQLTFQNPPTQRIPSTFEHRLISHLRIPTNVSDFISKLLPLPQFPSVKVFGKQDSDRCKCTSEKTGKVYDFCYINPKNTSMIGKPFHCAHLKVLETLRLVDAPELKLVDLSVPSRRTSDVIFVTAATKDHLGNFREMFALIKTHWPNQKMIFYALDLDEQQIKNLESDPMLIVRRFDYSIYPDYLKNWKEYRFKAIILAEVLRDYPNIWWTDTHNRWEKPVSLDKFYGDLAQCASDSQCDKKSSMMMFVNATHSNYAVLHKGFLEYFPTFDMDTLKTNEKGLQLSAAFVYAARTSFTMEIIKWHTLCALEEECMSPKTSKLECDTVPMWDVNAGCFRYDQSSLNLLLFNTFRNHNSYFMNPGVVTRTYSHY